MDKALADLWGAINPLIPYSPNLGICSFWGTNYKALGSPVGVERPSGKPDGVIFQAFARGIVRWTPGKGAEII